MKSSNELREELKELSPFLAARQGEKEGFEVPKNYFKSLPDEVLNRLREDLKPALTQSSWLDGLATFFQNLWQPRLAWAVASVAFLAATAVWLFTKNSAELPVSKQVALEEISDEAIHAYLSKNIEEVDNELLFSATALETPDEPAAQPPKSAKTTAPVPDADELEKYLEENIEDLNLEDLEEML